MRRHKAPIVVPPSLADHGCFLGSGTGKRDRKSNIETSVGTRSCAIITIKTFKQSEETLYFSEGLGIVGQINEANGRKKVWTLKDAHPDLLKNSDIK